MTVLSATPQSKQQGSEHSDWYSPGCKLAYSPGTLGEQTFGVRGLYSSAVETPVHSPKVGQHSKTLSQDKAMLAFQPNDSWDLFQTRSMEFSGPLK